MRCNLEPEGVPRPKMANDPKGQQEDAPRNRGQRDQAYINEAVNALPAAASLAGGKVAFVVAAHLRRQAGNIVPPARKNFPYDGIDALLTHKEPKAAYNRIDGKTSDCIATSTRFWNNPPRSARATSASLLAISG